MQLIQYTVLDCAVLYRGVLNCTVIVLYVVITILYIVLYSIAYTVYSTVQTSYGYDYITAYVNACDYECYCRWLVELSIVSVIMLQSYPYRYSIVIYIEWSEGG
jgi:hypothetical protein